MRDEARRTVSSRRRRSVEGQPSSPRRVDESVDGTTSIARGPAPSGVLFQAADESWAPARVTAADGRRASKRLHQEAQLRRETQMRKRKEAQQLSEEHTFQPQLIASKTDTFVEDPSLRRPLHERVAAVERARQLRRDALEKRVRAEKRIFSSRTSMMTNVRQGWRGKRLKKCSPRRPTPAPSSWRTIRCHRTWPRGWRRTPGGGR